MTVVKGVLNNGEHMLILVMAKMIHSTIWDSERFILKDGQPLQMVKLVGAVRNFRVNNKHVQIDVEDVTGLVRVILWKEQKECMAQRQMIHECNSNCYICVIEEVKDYYGVHEIITFNVRPVSSGNEVTHHFLEVAYLFQKRLDCTEDVESCSSHIIYMQIVKLMYCFICLLFVITCSLLLIFCLSNISLAAGHNNCLSLQLVFYACFFWIRKCCTS
jgi:hypothetical protein